MYLLPWRLRVFLCEILKTVAFPAIRGNRDVALAGAVLRNHCPREAFDHGGKISFEGIQFSAPLDYDRVLTKMYGDYMTPPPPEKRGYGHELTLGKIIYDCEKDYRDYLKEMENP